MIGKKLSPILSEIEDTLLEFEANVGAKPEFTEEGFRAGIKIFMSVMLDKTFELQIKEGFSEEDAGDMANKMGEDLRKFVKTYADIDTHDLYK